MVGDKLGHSGGLIVACGVGFLVRAVCAMVGLCVRSISGDLDGSMIGILDGLRIGAFVGYLGGSYVCKTA